MKDPFSIKDLFSKHGSELDLELVWGTDHLNRPINVPEIQRPGLSLTGYFKGNTIKRIHLFGRAEIGYLRELKSKVRTERLKAVLSKQIPAVIVSRKLRPIKELLEICKLLKIPLLRSSFRSMQLLNQMTVILSDALAPTTSCHGTLVEAFGIGVLIQGGSSVGKSEAALGLIERGHRLITDDVVKIKKREGTYLEGTGPELTRHLIEIRGIGIINVAHLYGAICISEARNIDMIIKLEEWDDSHFYDRVGLEENYYDFLGIKVPYYMLPVKPGRDIVLLLETTVLNHRLKQMGYNSAKEFNVKLLDEISKRRKRTLETHMHS